VVRMKVNGKEEREKLQDGGGGGVCGVGVDVKCGHSPPGTGGELLLPTDFLPTGFSQPSIDCVGRHKVTAALFL
jgi:hypothetical protein